jgi:hypothetical protein
MQQHRYRMMMQSGSGTQAGTMQQSRLRDGSCGALPSGAMGTGTMQQSRLRDGSGLGQGNRAAMGAGQGGGQGQGGRRAGTGRR